MKRQFRILTLVLSCILAVIAVSPFQIVTAAKTDFETVAAGNNAFAMDLYGKLRHGPGNLFFSPYSITSALVMTYAGARGETARQMATTLHFTLPPAALHPAQAELMARLNAAGKPYQLAVANALWGQSGYKFEPEFLEITKKYYGAGFREVDFSGQTEAARLLINGWVEEKTRKRITNLIPPDTLDPLTRLVLTNAVYFKGKWEVQFKKDNTKEQPFYLSPQKTVNVPLMYQVGKFNYAANDLAQIVELPYAGDDLSMVVLLPKAETGLAKLEGALRPEALAKWLGAMAEKRVDLFLPRFKMVLTTPLNNNLRELGMVDAFNDAAANFSGMTPAQLAITGVIHKAFVEVNEEGTEAAAATAVIIGTKSVKVDDDPVMFRADRPFLFLIRDRRTGCILFMGRVNDPR